MRAAVCSVICVALAACDFDGDLGRWRCAHGHCGDGGAADGGDDAGASDAGLDAGFDAGSDDAGADAGFDAGWVFAPDGSYNFVFVTSMKVSADQLGGAAAADALCAACARDAGLPGVFAAWTSELGQNAFDRTGMFRARGWKRVDGKPFADTPADLAEGRVLYPLRLDEHGADVGFDSVLTGVRAVGDVDFNCGDFTGQARIEGGCTGCGGIFWSEAYDFPCSQQLRVACFGVDQARALEPLPVSGPLVFVSHPWAIDGGLAGADAWCNAEAASLDAGAPFIALLATSTASAASRLSGDGGWSRLDGVVVGDLRAPLLDAPFERFIDGTVAVDTTNVLTGWTSRFLPAADTRSTCGDWTSYLDGGILNTVVTGDPLKPDNAWFNHFKTPCAPLPVYCVQP